ncbi:MAG TPA: hypothetical protein GXX37_13475 [Clostridiaceae bacterium]|nr:hypothetical protein [Clostridiaceae bacterium]
MQLGWIDFSKREREKVLDVINLLTEEGAIDELGIGVIRDSFANLFFPGTSTVQTRAKYFLIVSYILKEAEEGKYGDHPEAIFRRIDEEERKCALKLLENDRDGVIGARVLPDKWVIRTPSNIYWNGIKTLKIFTDENLSIQEYIRLVCSLRKQKNAINLGNRNDDAENEGSSDDKDAAETDKFYFWNLPSTYKTNWRENLRIQLLPEEAAFLKQQIIKEVSDTLFAFLLKNHIDVNKYDTFEALYEDLKYEVSESLRKDMLMACEFNNFIQIAFTQYNLIISAGKNSRALDKWEKIRVNIDKYAMIDLDAIFFRLRIVNPALKAFLKGIRTASLEKDIDRLRQLIINRENNLKSKARAKVNRVGEFDENAWIGLEYLDYRFSNAKRIINDIYEGEQITDV